MHGLAYLDNTRNKLQEMSSCPTLQRGMPRCKELGPHWLSGVHPHATVTPLPAPAFWGSGPSSRSDSDADRRRQHNPNIRQHNPLYTQSPPPDLAIDSIRSVLKLRFLFVIMRSLGVAAAVSSALLTGASYASTLKPPVLPLIVRNPYLSTWLGNAREEPWHKWPIFWTGEEVSCLNGIPPLPDANTAVCRLDSAF